MEILDISANDLDHFFQLYVEECVRHHEKWSLKGFLEWVHER